MSWNKNDTKDYSKFKYKHVYIYMYINLNINMYIYMSIYNSKSLAVVQSLYFCNKLLRQERTNKAIQITQDFSLQTRKGTT